MNSLNSNQPNNDVNAQIESLYKRLEERDIMIHQLMSKLGMNGNGENSPDPMPKPKNSQLKVAQAGTPKSKSSPRTNSQKTTPVNRRSVSGSAPPYTPVSSAKKNPFQMNKSDQPAGFERTRDAFYMHIRLMWGLVAHCSVPTPPDPALFREFNKRFSDPKQIEAVIYGTRTQNLVAESEIKTLRDAKTGRVQIGKCMAHISQFFLEYMWATLAKLGLRVWAPDLDAQIDSLYNKACQMSAIITFRQAVANKVYTYMSVNPAYLKDVALLQSTYNHYVHFHMAQIYSKERKESGKHTKDEEKKVIQRSRQRLCDARLRFAKSQKLPQRYLDVLKPIQAHSDDEYFPKQDVYIVKGLPFCSNKATTFMRRLDEVMKQNFKSINKRVQQRRRIRVKNAPETIFPEAPEGLPIDFYDPEWFNSKLPAQKQRLANNRTVAFLPNLLLSLTPKVAKEEFVGSRTFNKRHWSEGTKDYDFSYEEACESEEEDTEDDENENDSDYGASIDLNAPSDPDEESEDEYEEEEEFKDEDQNNHEVSYIDRPKLVEDEVMNDADFNEEFYGRSNFYGGMANNEWADYQ